MPNSVVIANVEIQLQDGLQSSIPPVIFRTVPPVSFPSNVQVAYNGYTKVYPGNVFTIVGVGGIAPSECPFVYVRNAGPSGLMLVKAIGAAGAGEMDITLKPGGVFLFANGPTGDASHNFMNSLTVSPTGASDYAIIVEWMAAT